MHAKCIEGEDLLVSELDPPLVGMGGFNYFCYPFLPFTVEYAIVYVVPAHGDCSLRTDQHCCLLCTPELVVG